MSATCETRLRIPFHDVDAMSIVWHGNYYRYFEIARCDLLRGIGLDIGDLVRLGYALPVIRSNCRHVKPLRYGQEIEVHSELTECEIKLVVKYSLRVVGESEFSATGSTEHVVLRSSDFSLLVPVPQDLLSLMQKGQA